ncbi:MAG: Zn-dependent M28 family amino/carboxypeptidase [Planctomycetota bacterium]|jgi:Zn-dependent M28 family amino/carboxypeptidase
MTKIISLVICTAVLLASCGQSDSESTASTNAKASGEVGDKVITAQAIRGHVEVLSSDEFEGRGPNQEGGKKARDYLIEQLKSFGVKPGNNGSWRQQVPLREINNTRLSSKITGEGVDWNLKHGAEFVAENRRGNGIHAVEGELVFVGHGVQAPEYDWDDYKGLDCKGKILVMLVGDPPCVDEKLFGGKAMTYYGRWTYKFDKARDMGAAGCIVVHRTKWAGYRWEVVSNSNNGRHMDVLQEDANTKEAAMEAWVPWGVAGRMMEKTGKTLEQWCEIAATKDFKPVPLQMSFKGAIRTRVDQYTDENIVGILPGRDPKLKHEYVIYSAHWDHLGKPGGEEPGTDGIYNGAVDNASGCAAVLSMAEAFASLKGNHDRSVMFLFVCSEEQGLLGSKYYALNPIIPPSKTVANINIDGLGMWDRTEDLQVVGFGQSSLDGLLKSELEKDGRYATPDAEPQKGLYYRSDHFNFAKIGIPALYTKTGDVVKGKPVGYLVKIKDSWTATDYHKVSDELRDIHTCLGAEADARVLFRIGQNLVTSEIWPEWSKKSEFRARREKSMGR